MNVEQLPLKDAKVLRLDRKHDHRGWFTETFRKEWLPEAGISNEFIFEFWSLSEFKNTVRGMHSQTADQPQAKLVSVLNGSIMDVLVDAREDSPTFGQYCTVTLTSYNSSLIYVPRGFYHGFITLEPNTYVGYKLDNYYLSSAECGLSWDDPTINIDWKAITNNCITSIRDRGHPGWNDCYKFKGTL